MWIIASIPFWILGAACFVIVCAGTSSGFSNLRKRDLDECIRDFGFSSLFLVGAGVLWLIAAKVAS